MGSGDEFHTYDSAADVHPKIGFETPTDLWRQWVSSGEPWRALGGSLGELWEDLEVPGRALGPKIQVQTPKIQVQTPEKIVQTHKILVQTSKYKSRHPKYKSRHPTYKSRHPKHPGTCFCSRTHKLRVVLGHDMLKNTNLESKGYQNLLKM